jgi:2-keto-4-pentenoate hydratase/2-oxohepta-3-ene-1,7-dioic acid hydratase in catechol pathway
MGDFPAPTTTSSPSMKGPTPCGVPVKIKSPAIRGTLFEKKQKGNQNEMIFSFVELIHFLSNKVPLMAGDLIFTGTPHGVGPLIDGDEVVVGVGKTTLNKFVVSSEE